MRLRQPVDFLRWLAFACLAILCLGSFSYIFYQNDWKLTTERPRPAGYPQTPARLSAEAPQLVLYHFYSPTCPCSRFVWPEVEALAKQYQGRVKVVAVSAEPDPDARAGLRPVIDTSEALARSMGIYCTPQAVLVGPQGQVLYTGTYNRARFCNDGQTAFVAQALHDYYKRGNVRKPKGPVYGCLLPALQRKEAS